MSTEYTAVPLEEGQNKQENVPTPTADELCMMARSTRGVALLCLVQMAIGALMFTAHGFIIGGVIAAGVFLGILGVAKKNPCCLIAHFVFSLLLYIFSMLVVMGFIVYCNQCNWGYFVAGLLVIFAQAIGMRHSRILITLTRKFRGNNRCCMSRRWCRASQTTQTHNPSVQTQTAPVQSSIQTQTPTPMMFFPQPQVDPKTGLPTQQYYPQPMFVPPGFVPMPAMNMRGYPMSYPMVPMMPQPPMVPPPVYPPSAPQENQPQIYPVFPRQDS